MAEVGRFFNPASSGGNGTTNALSGPNAAYATLAAWNSAEATNLVTDGDNHTLNIEGTTEFSAATSADLIDLSSWTANSSNTLTIKGTTRPSGAWSTSLIRLKATNAQLITGGTFTSGDAAPALIIENLQFEYAGTFSVPGFELPLGFRMANCHVRFTSTGGGAVCVTGTAGASTQAYLINNIFESQGTTGTLVSVVGGPSNDCVITYQNSFYGANVAFNSSYKAALIKNCAFDNQNTSDLNDTDDESDNSTNNVTSLAVARTGFTTGVTMTWGDAANGDFTTSDTDLVDSGADLSADAEYNVTDDIAGTTRSSHDIGAYEYVAAASGGPKRLVGNPLTNSPLIDSPLVA